MKILKILLSLMLLSSCLTKEDATVVEGFEVQLSKYVVGSRDNRRLLTKNTVDRSTVAIVGENNNLVCTGTAIGTYFVLTAAHCLFDKETKQIRRDLTVIPYIHMAEYYKPYTRFLIKNMYVPKSYTNAVKGTASSIERDIGIIKVRSFQNAPIFGDVVKIREVGTFADVRNNNNLLSMVSYTGEESKKALSQYRQESCYYVGPVRINSGAFKHDCDTMPGTSGSGMVSGQKVVGVNTSHSTSSVYNFGAIINDTDYEEISHIINREPEYLRDFQDFDVKGKAYVGLEVRNKCPYDIQFAIQYIDTNGEKQTKGYYTITPNTLKLLNFKMSNYTPLVHAVSTDGKNEWKGNKNVFFYNQNRPFMEISLRQAYEDGLITFDCS
jgi:V8-like Glu-specific endopeptidase